MTAKLLADRAAAAALTGPTVPAGQWVYPHIDPSGHGASQSSPTANSATSAGVRAR
jgi:hypothetical protein